MQIVSLILDISVIAMIFFPILSGIRRGIKGTVLMLIAMAVSAAVGFLGSKMLAPTVYDRYLSNSVHVFCLERAGEYDPVGLSQNILSVYGADVSEENIRLILDESDDMLSYAGVLAEQNGVEEEQIQELVDQLSAELLRTAPEAVQDTVPELVKEVFSADFSASDAFDAVRAAASSPEDIAEYSEENYVRPVAVAIVRTLLFSVICLFVRFIFFVVYTACGLDVNGIHAGRSDRAAGALLGLVQGAAQVVILMLFVSAVEKTSAGLFTADRLNSAIFLPIYRIFFG